MRVIILFAMLALLVGTVVWEQVYIDNTVNKLQELSGDLYANLEQDNLTESKALANEVHNYWNERQTIITLLVDFRDIEQLGRQSSYIISYLDDEDFELARSECQQFIHLLENFGNMTRFDMHNIL